jgi:hypothetical protein
MLTQTDLPEDPVTLVVRGAEGHEHTVTVERRLGGGVGVTCSCALFAREAWCRHSVDVLCMRLRALGVSDDGLEFALEQAVLGTRAEDVAHELDRALIAYERALKRFDESRSHSLAGDVVDTMGAIAREIADAAATLGDAALRFKRALEAPAVAHEP